MFGKKMPDEIRNLIFAMNPEHRELFKKLRTLIEVKGCLSRLENISEMWSNGSSELSYNKYFKECVNDPEHMLRKFHLCACCDRHKTKKPISINDGGDYDSNIFPSGVIKEAGGDETMMSKSCQCKCRHKSRAIFEAYRANLRYDDDFEFEGNFTYEFDFDYGILPNFTLDFDHTIMDL
jgi:hypothetical protein